MIFTAALLLIFCALGFAVLMLGRSGDTVTVTVDQTVYGKYPLGEDRTVEIRHGDAMNLLVIRDGRASVESASCPDGICVSHRPISRNGESIICLPNKVVISVSSEKTNAPDIVA